MSYSKILKDVRSQTVNEICSRSCRDTATSYVYEENDRITVVVDNKKIIDRGVVVDAHKDNVPPSLRVMVDIYGALTKLLVEAS
jgi:hypothetical protein